MKHRSRFLVVAILVLALGSIAGGRLNKQQAQVTPGDALVDNAVVRSFVKALQLVDENYVSATDQERLTKAAILGMLHRLDPHSSFFDRREYNEMRQEQRSEFYGIGVTINQRNGRIYVLGVSPGLPAERAGLRYGDAIIAVDGKSARDWTQSDALKHVRGERGAPVEITVERAGEPRPIPLRVVRDKVPFPSVRNHFPLRPGIGYIALTGGFNETTSDELRAAIDELKTQGMTSLILDLRRNPGGLLKQAIQVAETFLPRDVEIVTVRARDGRIQKQTYKSENTEPERMPLVVLINRETASASEIVAGAIQDHDRGLIIGEDSFGKGLVQSVYPLPGGTGLTLTTAKYYTPSGRSIQRAYNGVGFYDYYFARRHAQAEPGTSTGNSSNAADQPSSTSSPTPRALRQGDSVFTPTGRELHGGGGIMPDILIKLSEGDLRWRDACFEFARHLVAGVVTGLEQYKVTKTQHGYHLKGQEYQLTDQVLAAFRAFLREHPEFRLSETQMSAHLDYIRRRIRAEVITAAYGIEVAEQFLLESDEQAQRAIEAIPKAKHLTDTARLFSPSSKN
jgi:carboxyl-terminal processing protease